MIDLREVRTARLLLRATEPGDWRTLHEMDSDPIVMKTLGGVRSLEETKAYVAAQALHWEDHGFGWWMAFDRETSDFVGRGGVRRIEVEGEKHAEVGYGLMSAYWGKGLATELAAIAVDAGLGALNLSRLIGLTQSANLASRRVLEKVGFRYVRDADYKGLPHLLYQQTKGLNAGPRIG